MCVLLAFAPEEFPKTLNPTREEAPSISYQVYDEGKVILRLRVLNEFPQGYAEKRERENAECNPKYHL